MPTVYQLKCDIRKIDPKAKISMNKAGLVSGLRRLQIGTLKNKINTKKSNIADARDKKMALQANRLANQGLYGTKAIDNGSRFYTAL